MHRTVTRLSDGRELIYFDDRGGAERSGVDTRDLAPSVPTSELRYDPVMDEWVAIASHRQGRTHLPPSTECPLCPSSPERATEIPSADYDVVVFENRFPSLSLRAAGGSGSEPDVAVGDGHDGLSARRPGTGRCDVVCFTSDHNSSFARLTPARARTVIDAWADRTAALGALPTVEYVFPFENRGEEIGVTLGHPHGQVYAYPFVPSRPRRMLDTARRHQERTGGNLFADVLAAELRDGSRVVVRGRHWTAFVPQAARWPMEVHLYPDRRVEDLPALSDAERDDLAVTYLDVLRRLDALYDAPLPYIAAWQQAPVHQDRDLAYCHLQVFSIKRAAAKLKYLAGSESGAGAFINDVVPEQAAQMLRDVRA